MFWPDTNHDIALHIARCSTCQENRKAEPAKHMIPHTIPKIPWMKVGVDLFHFTGQTYLPVVDYHSKYPDICMLPKGDTSSEATIAALKSIYSRFGIPTEVVSGGGPQFASHDVFKQFIDHYDFRHTGTSPTNAKSNGQAERMVQTVKQLLQKCDDCTISFAKLQKHSRW